MFVRPLTTAREIVALVNLVRIGRLTGGDILCIVAMRFVIHRYASINSVDEINAADDVPSSSLQVDCLR
jgi:hypothetical protein